MHFEAEKPICTVYTGDMTWQTFAFLIVAGAAFSYSGFRFFTLYKLMKTHQGKVERLDRIGERVITTLLNVLGQQAVLKKKGIGIAHTLIFWGFLVITVGTLEQFATTLHTGANFTFIGEGPYRVLAFLQDTFTFAVLSAVGFAAYRRYVIRPEHLGQSSDANRVLVFTASLMVSIFLMNAFHILADQPSYAGALWVSSPLAAFLKGTVESPDSAHHLSTLFKWIHMLLVLGFAVYIPGSKHLHIVAAGPNTFLKTLDRAKGMKPIRFEDESITQYGAAKVSDLSWKDGLDYYACTECGRCQEVCPAHNTQKPLSPKNLILDLKDNLYTQKEKLLAGKTDEVGPIIGSHITEDVIWACTSCRACEIACPVFIEHTDKIYDIRRNLVLMESKFPSEVQTVFKNMETNASPWAFAASDRGNWADGLHVRTMAEDSNVEVLLWVGCAGSFDDRNKKVLKAFVNLLKKAEVKFAILGNEEQCTGDPARRIGNEYLFQTLATANVETLNRYQVKKIVTACPHCFNTLKNEYKDFGGTYEVIHHSEYLAQMIASGRLKPTKAQEQTITFHDSCYLGRWNNIYDQPRQVLSALPGARLVEMKSNHDQSMCCGAGGGRMWMEETIGKRINITRAEQALDTKAAIVAASCPFCMTMMTDGVKSKDMQDKVKVMDIAELLNDSMA
jgi:Fe-S oxidoreductase